MNCTECGKEVFCLGCSWKNNHSNCPNIHLNCVLTKNAKQEFEKKLQKAFLDEIASIVEKSKEKKCWWIFNHKWTSWENYYTYYDQRRRCLKCNKTQIRNLL